MASFSMGPFVQSGRAGLAQAGNAYRLYEDTLDHLRMRNYLSQQYQISQNLMPNQYATAYMNSVSDLMKAQTDNWNMQGVMAQELNRWLNGSGVNTNALYGNPSQQGQATYNTNQPVTTQVQSMPTSTPQQTNPATSWLQSALPNYNQALTGGYSSQNYIQKVK